jgi:outer membrane protein assembly factor BamB
VTTPRVVIHCALLLMLLLVAPAQAEDWPRWRGPRGDGTWFGPKLPTTWPKAGLPVVWRKPIGGGYAGVSIANGRAITMDRPADTASERVLCFDMSTGDLLWSHTYAADYSHMRYDNGPRAAPTIHDGKVYTLGAIGHAHCLDAMTGEVLWSIDTVAAWDAGIPIWGFAASPVVRGDTVILHVGAQPGGCLVAVDRTTGEERWRSLDDPAGYCTPIIITTSGGGGGGDQLINWNPKRITSVNPDTGKLNWAFDFPITNGVSIATPIFADGIIFIASFWHGAKAIELGDTPRDATILWEDELLRGLMSQPLYRDGHAYLLERQFGLVCFNYRTGQRQWQDENPPMTRRERNPQAAMMWLANSDTPGSPDRVLILNALGDLILARFTPTGYIEQSRTHIIDETWAHPALSDNHLVARSDTQILCVRLTD